MGMWGHWSDTMRPFLEANKGGGTSGAGGAEAAAKVVENASNDVGKGEEGGGAEEGEQTATKVTFTAEQQVELERILKQRVARAERKAKEDAQKAQEEAQKKAAMSDLEKAQAEAKEAQDKLKNVLEEAKKARIDAALLVAATKAGAIDANDVLLLADREGIDYDEDAVTVTGAADVVEKLKAAKPHLFSTGEAGVSGARHRDGAASQGNKPADVAAKILKQQGYTNSEKQSNFWK